MNEILAPFSFLMAISKKKKKYERKEKLHFLRRISTRRNHRRIRDRKKIYYSDWLKIFGKFFRHEKVGIISTFS